MKTRLTDLFFTLLLLIAAAVTQTCGYDEMGHANTPAEHPGSQTQPGVDTIVHPGNIDRDTIRLHE